MRRALIAGAAGLAVREAIRRREPAYDLHDKTALVTGGSRGLGFAIARELVDEGARVVICARDLDRLERARARLAEHGGNVRAIRCDVGDNGQVEAMVAEIGHVDVLVNNAGVIAVGPLETQRLEDFREQHDVMFWGVVQPTLAVLPGMLARGDGRIANITSIGGKISVPYLLPYSAAKFGAVGFSEGLRTELARKGVLVTTVVPGLMRTGSYVAALFKGRRETLYRLFTPISTLPVSSISGRRAAQKIVAAIKRGDPELILTVHANVVVRCNALAPATTQRVLSVVARLLPHGGTTEPLPGTEIHSPLDESLLTALGRRARAELNQP
ncbi:MAG TPA: SDR family oxidoreductase [Gaiellaceae bacterium]|jgi:short-subunit dehydrogenase|nr:SDR family oxidoreductase [Gaiellaceae bacterium]